MTLKSFKPNTPGRRQMTSPSFEEITKSKPEKRLIKRLPKFGGRNFRGKITMRHIGGGARKIYRMVDFDRTAKLGIEGTITAVEYDPNRTAYIMLVLYKDGDKRYHLACSETKVGQIVICKEKAKIKPGNRMKLKNIPIGYNIFNVELHKGKGGQMGRSAGTIITLVSLEGEKAQIQLPSGEVRLVDKDCYADIGISSNIEYNNISWGKAGRRRHMGHRPKVRGKVMNPVDHPHGGGEGKNPIGLKYPKTKWGLPALGVATRRRKYTDKFIIKRRKKRTQQAELTK